MTPSLDFTLQEWIALSIAALGIGISKTGLAGISMVHVLIFATVFEAKRSTGVVLPMLIIGDLCTTWMFGNHARWNYVKRMLPPALVGVTTGWLTMHRLDESLYRPLIGAIILVLTVLQFIRLWREDWMQHVPHKTWFAWLMGWLAGFTTMLANAAGPVFALFLLAVSVPKMAFVGTSAWFFLILNSSKIPFSWQLGLIDWSSLWLNLLLAPWIPVGVAVGRRIVQHIPQRLFNGLILAFTAVASIFLLL